MSTCDCCSPDKGHLLEIHWGNCALQEMKYVSIQNTHRKLITDLLLHALKVRLGDGALQTIHDRQKTATNGMDWESGLVSPTLLHSSRLPVPITCEALDEQPSLSIQRKFKAGACCVDCAKFLSCCWSLLFWATL